jgi:hypothetical protein
LGYLNTPGYSVAAFVAFFAGYYFVLRNLSNRGFYTYRVPERGQEFDHFWVGPGAHTGSDLTVAGPCNASSLARIERYNHDVSDHCPVTVELRF